MEDQQTVETNNPNFNSLSNNSDPPRSILKSKHSVNLNREAPTGQGTKFNRAVGLILSIAD